jgi:hypothetical protein
MERFDWLFFFASFAIPLRALRSRAFELAVIAFEAFDRKVREGLAKFAKDAHRSPPMATLSLRKL